MSDQSAEPQAAATPQMKILGQYIRDMSFENVMASKGMTTEAQPEIEVQVALKAHKKSADDQYEVVQKYKITARNKGTTDMLFLLELEYGGLFLLSGIPEDKVHPIALIECPRMLFPYVRRIVGDITRDGGFPQLNLDNVDFLKLYQQEIQRRAKEQSANNEPV